MNKLNKFFYQSINFFLITLAVFIAFFEFSSTAELNSEWMIKLAFFSIIVALPMATMNFFTLEIK